MFVAQTTQDTLAIAVAVAVPVAVPIPVAVAVTSITISAPSWHLFPLAILKLVVLSPCRGVASRVVASRGVASRRLLP